jgi:hypothetical protein
MDNKNLAPICLFVYNRLELTKQTVAALQKNFLASESELFIFSDGHKNENDIQKVNQVREYIKTISGFKKVTLFESIENMGLANSIISGVTKIIEQYGKVIVVEDDLITSPNFLDFMNQSLEQYEKEEKIFSISAFSFKIKRPKSYEYDNYCWGRAHSWGWATWKDRWQTVDWKISDYENFIISEQQQKLFNRYGIDLSRMLKAAKEGRISSWYILFNYNQFKQNRLAIYPVLSKVFNNGFVEEATNCTTYNRVEINFDNTEKRLFQFLDNILINKKIHRQLYHYKSLSYKVIGRILTILMRKGIIKQRISKI